MRSVLAACLLVGLSGALPAPAAHASEAGWGLGSAVSTLFYAPVKVLYAASGLVFAGIGWGLSRGEADVVDTVIAPAVRGDYVVTPAHLRGERELRFIGTAPGHDEPGPDSADRWDPEDPYADVFYGDAHPASEGWER